MAAKLIAKPVAGDKIASKARSITGFNRWASQSRFGGFVMRLLAWIALPFEVCMRRDFGERWFTPLNYFAGMFYLFIFFGLQFLILILMMYVVNLFSGLLSFLRMLNIGDFSIPEGRRFSDLFSIHSNYNPYITMAPYDMVGFFIAYVIIGQFHLFKIRWRAQAGIPLHSFDDGTSRLQGAADWLAKIVNKLTAPLMWLFFSFIPEKQRKDKKPPKMINDTIAFANTVVEPMLIFLIAKDATGVMWLWCVVSAIAVKIQGHLREQNRNDRRLDFQDGKVEAEMMRDFRNAVKEATAPLQMQSQKPVRSLPNPPVRGDIKYPPLQVIIEENAGQKMTTKNRAVLGIVDSIIRSKSGN